MLRPLGNQSPAKHAIWCKNDGDMSLRLFSRAWQAITKKIKKNYTINFWTLYFTPLPGGPCWADCSKFLHVGWHPRRNHAYQILSRSRLGLRSYGGPKSGFSYAFLNGSYNSVTHYRATLWLINWSSRTVWIGQHQMLGECTVTAGGCSVYCTPLHLLQRLAVQLQA